MTVDGPESRPWKTLWPIKPWKSALSDQKKIKRSIDNDRSQTKFLNQKIFRTSGVHVRPLIPVKGGWLAREMASACERSIIHDAFFSRLPNERATLFFSMNRMVWVGEEWSKSPKKSKTEASSGEDSKGQLLKISRTVSDWSSVFFQFESDLHSARNECSSEEQKRWKRIA